MGETTKPVSISVIGPLRVVTTEGTDITPSGAKNQALLALLALLPA